MIEHFISGIWLGLVSGSLCVGCWAILLPIMASSGKGSLKASAGVFLQFTLGRLLAYIAFGAVIGFVGSRLSNISWIPLAASIAFIPLSAILLLQAFRGGKSGLCRGIENLSTKSRLPFWVGAALGMSVCPPFLIETVRVLQAGSPAAGMASFAGFFLGATIFMAPVLFFGLAGRAEFFRNLGRAACLLAALFFFYRGLAGIAGIPDTSSVEVTQQDLEALLPEAAGFGEWVVPSNGPRYREAFDSHGMQAALVYLSSDICPEIRGFGGHVPLIAAVKPGTLLAIRLLPGWETPSYITRIYDERYVEDFRNRPASAPLKPGDDIDVVTGATVTNRAICDEVRALLASTIGTGAAGRAGRAFPASAIFLICGFAAAALAYILRLRWLRMLILAGSIFYLGFYMKGLVFSSADVARLLFFSEGFSGMGIEWFVLVAGIALTSIVFGRLFCGYLCPFGALHELSSRPLGGKLELSMKTAGKLRYVKYAVLFAAPALFLATGRISDAAVEPFGTLFSLGGSALQWAFLVFVLAAGLFIVRFFCRFLCPAGALMSILSMARIYRDRRREDCKACGKCVKACPSVALKQEQSILDADYTECLNCTYCVKIQRVSPCAKGGGNG